MTQKGFSFYTCFLLRPSAVAASQLWRDKPGLRNEAGSGLGAASCRASSGFSLVELSIVLVILGLLTGGILAGQSLIRAAELRSVSTELNRWITSTRTFQDKYFALPGDMANAHSFWGSAGGSGVIGDGCETGSTTSTETCSGDGNGTIETNAASEFSENLTFWQHLANAGLIEGSYTGIAGSGGVHHAVPDENAPRSRLGSGLWGIASPSVESGNPNWYDGNYPHRFFFGVATSTGLPTAPVLKPEEAWNIDTKIDDGSPATGIMVTRKSPTAPGCTTSDDESTAEYALTSSDTVCPAIFVPGL